MARAQLTWSAIDGRKWRGTVVGAQLAWAQITGRKWLGRNWRGVNDGAQMTGRRTHCMYVCIKALIGWLLIWRLRNGMRSHISQHVRRKYVPVLYAYCIFLGFLRRQVYNWNVIHIVDRSGRERKQKVPTIFPPLSDLGLVQTNHVGIEPNQIPHHSKDLEHRRQIHTRSTFSLSWARLG